MVIDPELEAWIWQDNPHVAERSPDVGLERLAGLHRALAVDLEVDPGLTEMTLTQADEADRNLEAFRDTDDHAALRRICQ